MSYVKNSSSNLAQRRFRSKLDPNGCDIEEQEALMADLSHDPRLLATEPTPAQPRASSIPEPSTAAAEAGGSKRRVRTRHACSICGKDVPARETMRLDVVRPAIVDRIREEYPDLPADGFICRRDLDRFRSSYVSEMLTRERGELTRLEEDVVQSLADHENARRERRSRVRRQAHLRGTDVGPARQFWRQLDLHWPVRCSPDSLDGLQRRGDGASPVRSLSIHSAQSGVVVSRRHPGADHHDEPEAAGGEGSAAVGERLSGQPQGRARNSPPTREDGPYPNQAVGAAGGDAADPTRDHAGYGDQAAVACTRFTPASRRTPARSAATLSSRRRGTLRIAAASTAPARSRASPCSPSAPAISAPRGTRR